MRILIFTFMLLMSSVHVQADDPPQSGASQSLTVMSFNVLCSFCDTTHYDPWGERLGYFRDIIVRHQPDLIGFQEIAKEEEVLQINESNPEYAALYFVDETGPKRRTYPDATIFYRKERFEVVAQGNYWLSSEPDKAWSKGWAKGGQFWRLVAWAHLKDKTAGREIYFATTHFDNNRPNQENSAPIILEKTRPWAEKMPCIVIGDFNSKPDSPAYSILTHGTEGNDFKLVNTFDLVKEWKQSTNQEPPLPYEPNNRIDHIWVAGKQKTEATVWFVDTHVYGARNRYPSDHFAIVAKLQLGSQ